MADDTKTDDTKTVPNPRPRFRCFMCTSARGVPGAMLFQFAQPWEGDERPDDDECPQCGSGLGIEEVPDVG